MRNPIALCGLFMCALLLGQPSPALPWYVEGHRQMTRAVVKYLPGMPRFFTEGASVIADCSGEPDLAKFQKDSALADREAPDHYIDLEYLKGERLPPTRSEYHRLVRQIAPGVLVGSLPYAIIEWAQRLTIAFAECRRWPGNEAVRMRCLVYAGILCHYCQDLWMPLHTTVHYDGRTQDGISPRSGVHDRMDGLIERISVNVDRIAAEKLPAAASRPPDDLFAAITAELEKSHAEVDRVYSMEKELLSNADDPRVRRLAADCAERAMAFSARVLAAAWRASERTSLPSWLTR